MWVKICGITDESTAEAVCGLSPDAIGLNFHPQSPRSVTQVVAARIAKLVPDEVLRVGVFVNCAIGEIEDISNECRLDQIQLHGDESPEQIAELRSRLPSVPVIRAWRMAGENLTELGEHLSACRAFGIELSGCLIDSRVSGAYGGTGHTVAWDALAGAYRRDSWPPLILAGGLTPDNVADAIRSTQPWGVDVASGVESAPGVKDIELVRRFIANARTV
ncbi:MAG: phosphoribosylanthranilate isomerase [Candidatus Saccharimonas sp.]|nr:phosphoribosylanthranilate isomerase [Planctomycetaceae bacterium]